MTPLRRTLFLSALLLLWLVKVGLFALPCLARSFTRASLDTSFSWQSTGPSIQKYIPGTAAGDPGRDSLSSTLILEREFQGKGLSEQWSLDGLLALRADMLDAAPALDDDLRIDPYRYWFRLSRPGFELRGGLQKITFGHCLVFRPLALFDDISFLDYTRKTSGQRGLRLRIFPRAGTEIQAWALHNRMDSASPHSGFRINQVFDGGEVGFTFHKRQGPADLMLNQFPEKILGFDFFLDIGPGLWGEYACHKDTPIGDYNLACLGMDYTFPSIGNGLHAGLEYLIASPGQGLDSRLSALALFWDIPLLDDTTHTGMVFHDRSLHTWGLDLRLRRDLSDNLVLEYGLSFLDTGTPLFQPIIPFSWPGSLSLFIADSQVSMLSLRAVLSF